jgi:hypothetical protein
VVDTSSGETYYWGDAKYDKNNSDKRYAAFHGNRVLETIYDLVLQNKRSTNQPILRFSKPRNGIVEFNGLCVINKGELTRFEDQGHPIRNHRTYLTILDGD